MERFQCIGVAFLQVETEEDSMSQEAFNQLEARLNE